MNELLMLFLSSLMQQIIAQLGIEVLVRMLTDTRMCFLYLVLRCDSLRFGTTIEISMTELFSSVTRISLMAGIELAGETPLLPER